MRSMRKTSVTPSPERAQPHNVQVVRRWLINLPARVVHRARQVFVRLAAGVSETGQGGRLPGARRPRELDEAVLGVPVVAC